MSKLKEQAPAILVTALVMGALLGGYAYYVNAKILPAQRAELESMRLAHAADLERSAAETRQEIAAVNQLLKDAIAARGNGLFATQEEAEAAEAAQVARLAEAVAQQLQPYNPLPKTPEEAEAMQNAQIDKVSGRLSERIQPILGQIAADQNLTRESLDRYAGQISNEVSAVLGGELARNERLGTQVQLTQSLAQESVALSSELTALYLSSIKDQGVINRLLLLPANIVRDASNFSLLNNEERRAKEAELTKRLRDIQTRLDAARTATDATVGNKTSGATATEPAVVVEPAPVRLPPTRPASS
ncbi:MAG: hypothetical protein MUE42_12720 [Opitutaceae bacterium]|jgi:hypothetical protein|nr:hypothetical protein [Opitutaceae bacterium]